MHPVMVEMMASIHREDLLAQAQERRRFLPVSRPSRWRRELAGVAMRLARRLDAAAVVRAQRATGLR